MILLWYNNSSAKTPLQKVLGLTLVKRAILSAQAASFDKILLAVHEQDKKQVTEELADSKIRATIELITDASTPLEALERSNFDQEKETAVALGDQVWTTPALKKLATPLVEDSHLRVLCAKNTDEPCAGLFRVKTSKLSLLPVSENKTPKQLEQTFSDKNNSQAQLEIIVIKNCSAKIHKGQNLRAAENTLLEALKKNADGIVSRHINRKISLFISRYLAKTSLHPNHITAVVATVGIFSGFANYFIGGYWGFFIGALSYYASAILDGCDGEISRLKYLGSNFGAWLDTIVDDIVCMAFSVGLYARLYVDSPTPFWFWTGIVGVFFYATTVLPRYYVLAVRMDTGDFQQLAAKQKLTSTSALSKATQLVKDTVFRMDFMPFYAFLTACVGLVEAYAIPFAIGAIASTVDSIAGIVVTTKKTIK